MSSGQKGVMLCERPGPSQVDTSPGLKPFLPSSLPSGLEPLGLVPTQKTFPPSLAPKPENIDLKTIAAVREMEEENRQAALQAEERRMAEAAKAAHVAAFGSQLRAAILSGEDVSFWQANKKAQAVRQSLEASKARAASGAASTSPARRGAAATELEAAGAGASRADMTSFVDDLVKEAAGSLGKTTAASAAPAASRSDNTADASTSGGCGAGAAVAPTPRAGSAGSGSRARGGAAAGAGVAGKAAAKPAWALTAEEVARLEDAEEDDLLKFADELDFDSFMAALDDAELQESVKALGSGDDAKATDGPAEGKAAALRRNLVKAMNNAAMRRVAAAAGATGRTAAADGDAASVAVFSEGGASRATAASRVRSEAGAAKRVAAAGEGGAGGWEGSTRGAEDVARMERAKAAASEAFDFLRENPDLRAVHSPASVRAMIGKTEGAVASAGGAS